MRNPRSAPWRRPPWRPPGRRDRRHRGRRRPTGWPAGRFGVFFDGRGDLLHRRRCFFQARGLLLGALRQVGRADGDSPDALVTSRVDGRDRPDRLLQAARHGVEVVLDLVVGRREPSPRRWRRLPSDICVRPSASRRTTLACSSAAAACASALRRCSATAFERISASAS